MAVTQIQNELGRAITVGAEVLDSGDVQIEIVGPNSETTNLLTRREAEALHLVLGVALDTPHFPIPQESST
jgi:hypothetical protein